MRRFDKRMNIIKANLLAEQRYLKSKVLIKEEEETRYYPEDLDKLIISAFSGVIKDTSDKIVKINGNFWIFFIISILISCYNITVCNNITFTSQVIK